MSELLPLFLNLAERDVVLVGGGRVAAGKLQQLLAAGARVRVVAPEVSRAIDTAGIPIARREFVPSDLDGAWLAVAAATPEANRAVAVAAGERRIFVNAVDDPPNASAFLGGVVRREGVTIAVSTSGVAPALTALLRQALDALLPRDLVRWMAEARRQRAMWRRHGVPMEARKPRLLQALNGLYEAQRANEERRAQSKGRSENVGSVPDARCAVPSALRPGHVSLVGAGPGDPGLLTRKAIARLRAADLVLYDALIDDRILRYARKAQRFFVGKRAGRHALTQQAIHGVMIRAARRGRRVVRLKGGDPFVFGRGGEEMLALERASVPFDVVPGVTSAVAAPALAGIPVTHRDVASAFCVVTGHDEDTFASAIEGFEPSGITLIILMGIGRSAALAERLVTRGWPTDTPAALIFDASRAGQQVWRGTIGGLAANEVEAGAGPGTIVIGDVVNVGRRVAASSRSEARTR